MGSYSTLTIGEIILSWKYEVPTFLTFLFQEGDLYIEREPPLPSDDDEPPHPPEAYGILRAGFRTTVAAARAALDAHGYTLDFFAGIYESFVDSLDHEVRIRVEDQIGASAAGSPVDVIELQAAAHLATAPPTPLGDLEAFTEFLRKAIATNFDISPLRGYLAEEARRWGDLGDARRFLLGDFDRLESAIFDHAMEMSPAILRPLRLLSEDWLFRFAEVVSLLYARLLLDASPSDATIDLEVTEIVEDEASLRSLHIDLAFMLLHKVDVYERVFRALSQREEDVRDRYNRQRARAELESVDAAGTPQQKGEALEQLMSSLFALPPALEVIARNYQSTNEEIDLVLKNNVDRPFWQALSSPLILVECKNWGEPVDPTVVNRFESKLRNRRPQTRVGILVAPNGLTRGAKEAIKNSARDNMLIVAVERHDLEKLVKGGSSVLDWLEEILSRPI